MHKAEELLREAHDTVDVHHLRRLWKPHKERLLAIREDHATPIRFHRACSWLSRAESMGDDDIDFALIAQWIALNSLYGQWDHGNRSPVADRECWRVFIERIVDLDTDGRIPELLQEHRPLVMSLFEDPYLSGLFWQDPTQERVGAAKRTRYSAQTWYFEKELETDPRKCRRAHLPYRLAERRLQGRHLYTS